MLSASTPLHAAANTDAVKVLITRCGTNTSESDGGLDISSHPTNPAIDEKVISDDAADTEARPIGQCGLKIDRKPAAGFAPLCTVVANLCFDASVEDSTGSPEAYEGTTAETIQVVISRPEGRC